MTNNSWRCYWAPFAWAAVLFVLSSIPDLHPPIHISRWDDKYGHILIYIPLGFLLMRSLMSSSRQIAIRRLAVLAVLLGTAYGIFDELHQYFVPGRSTDWLDVAADCLGTILGSIIYLKLPEHWQEKLRALRI